MSDDDQTTPLPRKDGPPDRVPTRPVPPEPDSSRMAAGAHEPVSTVRTPIIRRTWVRVSAAVAGGILLVGAGMGIGWGLAGQERGWDLAAQSGPGSHRLEGHGGMPGRDGERFGPGGQEHGGPGAADRDRDADAGQDADFDGEGETPLPSPSTTPAG